MNKPMHQMTSGELLTIALGMEVALNGDFFPLNEEQAKETKRRKAIALRLADESNEANRVLIDEDCEERKVLLQQLETWVEENSIKCYADRGDSGYEDPKEIHELLSCTDEDSIRQWYWDKVEEIEESYRCCDYDYETPHLIEGWNQISPYSEEPDGALLREAANDMGISVCYDVSDVVDTALRNSTAKIRAVPLLPNGDRIYCPHFEQGEDENAELVKDLNRIFAMDLHPKGVRPSGSQSWPDANYSGSYMAFTGTLDLVEICTKTFVIPNSITVSRNDDYFFFCSSNGSGSCSQPAIRRDSVTVRCKFLVDNIRANGYGVDETYGLTSRCWSEEHSAEFLKWDDDVLATYKDAKGRKRKIKVK